MNCCLWLNGKKIKTAAEIIDNFDLASLRGYFLGGSLIKWLLCNNGSQYAERLNEISAYRDINEGIISAFGMSGDSCIRKMGEPKSVMSLSPRPHSCPALSSFIYSIPNSLPCIFANSFPFSSFYSNQYKYDSLLDIDSFSPYSGSFAENSGGVFVYGSYVSYENYGSYGSFSEHGSLIPDYYKHGGMYPSAWSLQALNRYGYGINLIAEAKILMDKGGRTC